VAQGVGLTTAELREMIQGYYQAREWDENGSIPQKKLSELGLPAPQAGGLSYADR
jgi:aldehyde:ferredoxin oxidoreductase